MADTLDQPGHRLSILLVDDDPDLRQMYGSRLLADGFDVLLATDGQEALAAAMRPLGLILLDVRMPGMDGLDVLRRLKGDAHAGAVPVVMLSNESSTTAVAACRAMGAVAWWSKCEMVPAELSRRVSELLDLASPGTPDVKGPR